VIFMGCNYFHPTHCHKTQKGVVRYDGAAIRLVNTGSRTLDVSHASVKVGSCTFNPWPGLNAKVPGGHQLILTQTGGKSPCHLLPSSSRENFDVSQTGHSCTKNDGLIPVVHLTVSGTTLTYRDTKQVMNTGGVNPGAKVCGRKDETRDWAALKLKK
jgi:hypothetical protein